MEISVMNTDRVMESVYKKTGTLENCERETDSDFIERDTPEQS